MKCIFNLLLNLAKKIQSALYKIGLIADYVVERGTDGIWTYEKWESGTAKCWGVWKFSTVSFSQATSYAYGVLGIPQFPNGLFIGTPIILHTVGCDAISAGAGLGYQNPTTLTMVTNTPTPSRSVFANIIVIGKWK